MFLHLAHGIFKVLSIFLGNGDLYGCIELEPATMVIRVRITYHYHPG